MIYKEKRVGKRSPDPQASISKDNALFLKAKEFLKYFLCAPKV